MTDKDDTDKRKYYVDRTKQTLRRINRELSGWKYEKIDRRRMVLYRFYNEVVR